MTQPSMDRDELRDRVEQTLGFSGCRLPRVLTLAAQRRRAGGMVKQWSMDETKSWFYGRYYTYQINIAKRAAALKGDELHVEDKTERERESLMDKSDQVFT